MGMENRAQTGEVIIPKFVVNTLALLCIIEKALSSLFSFVLGHFYYFELEPSSNIQENHLPSSFEPPLSASIIRELLPAVKFSEVAFRKRGGGVEQPPQECAVCLYEFEGDQEIRCLKNCHHYFHKVCIDRWMDEDKKTCPICRESLIPVDSRKEYENSLLRADFCLDYCLFGEDQLVHNQSIENNSN